MAAKVTTTREGVAPIFSVSVSHLGVALAEFLYTSRVRATRSDMIQSAIIRMVPRAHARATAINKGQKRAAGIPACAMHRK